MIRPFINSNGEIRYKEVLNYKAPETGFYDSKKVFWQRKYKPFAVWIICRMWIPSFIRIAVLKWC